MAEAHNPATRDSWERARAQAAALGVACSELFPILGAVAVSETGRQEVLFGDRFNGQVLQTFQMELDLNYTLFDFGARTGRINAAKAQLWQQISFSTIFIAGLFTRCGKPTTGY
jgi:outer membrane protein